MVKPPNHFGKRAVSELAKRVSICIYRGSAIPLFLSILTFCSTHDCLRKAIIQLRTFSLILNYLYNYIALSTCKVFKSLRHEFTWVLVIFNCGIESFSYCLALLITWVFIYFVREKNLRFFHKGIEFHWQRKVDACLL